MTEQDQVGRTILVTGASTGLGLGTTIALAGRGARVILGCRSPERGAQALKSARAAATHAEPELLLVDLADLASIQNAAARFATNHDRLDVLVNNAGHLGPPATTRDGFEVHLGVNHLGHFALTAGLMPLLLASSEPRVVSVASVGHWLGRLPLDERQWRGPRRGRVAVYNDSKLANLIFARELDRRMKTADLDLISVAVHPGGTRTDLGREGGSRLATMIAEAAHKVVCQPLDMGILPHLHAITSRSLKGGEYVGPDGPLEFRGMPKSSARQRRIAADREAGRRLWELSEELTGVTFATDPRIAGS
jgi:protochlorophyllide reductase